MSQMERNVVWSLTVINTPEAFLLGYNVKVVNQVEVSYELFTVFSSAVGFFSCLTGFEEDGQMQDTTGCNVKVGRGRWVIVCGTDHYPGGTGKVVVSGLRLITSSPT